MAVFTPYFRRWEREPTRDLAPTPRGPAAAGGAGSGRVPAPADLATGATSPDDRGRRRDGGAAPADCLAARPALGGYDEDHDALAQTTTPAGCRPTCTSAACRRSRWCAGRGRAASAAQAFVRQVAWRDFHAQVLAARPDVTAARLPAPRRPLAPQRRGARGLAGGPHRLPDRRRRHAPAAARGVDAQPGPADRGALPHQDALHRLARGRRSTSSTCCVDGDVANNTMNWQWVAGTGTDSRFNRTYNVVLQARRHDPRGAYVRRYVEELGGVDDADRARAVAAARTTSATSSATPRRSSTRTRPATGCGPARPRALGRRGQGAWVRLVVRRAARRRRRCCGPCRRTRCRGTARPPTSRRARAARAGGTAPAARTSSAARRRRRHPFHAELEPGQPGQPHLGAQPQQLARVALLDPPEVDGLADVDPVRVPPTAPQPDPADEPVEQAADPPGQREGGHLTFDLSIWSGTAEV